MLTTSVHKHTTIRDFKYRRPDMPANTWLFWAEIEVEYERHGADIEILDERIVTLDSDFGAIDGISFDLRRPNQRLDATQASLALVMLQRWQASTDRQNLAADLLAE